MNINTKARAFDVIVKELNDFIDLETIKDDLPVGVFASDLNCVLFLMRLALSKAVALDEISGSKPNFEFFLEMAEMAGLSEEELQVFKNKSEGFNELHNQIFEINSALEDTIKDDNSGYYDLEAIEVGNDV